MHRFRDFVVISLIIVISYGSGKARAQESLFLDAVRQNEDSSQIKIAIPDAEVAVEAMEPGAAPAEELTGDAFDQLSAQREANIVDRAYPLMSAKWPFNKVFVCWEESAAPYVNEREIVHAAIRDTWEASSGLQFLGWGTCTANAKGIRIAVRDVGPHAKFMGKYLNGVKDGVVLNFTYANWGTSCQQKLAYCDRVIAVHEFGHAIGFAHEQNRPDTPGDCDKAPQGTSGDNASLTPWDEHSVMNYCNPTYSNDGVLSPFDVVAVQYIYGTK